MEELLGDEYYVELFAEIADSEPITEAIDEVSCVLRSFPLPSLCSWQWQRCGRLGCSKFTQCLQLAAQASFREASGEVDRATGAQWATSVGRTLELTGWREAHCS